MTGLCISSPSYFASILGKHIGLPPTNTPYYRNVLVDIRKKWTVCMSTIGIVRLFRQIDRLHRDDNRTDDCSWNYNVDNSPSYLLNCAINDDMMKMLEHHCNLVSAKFNVSNLWLRWDDSRVLIEYSLVFYLQTKNHQHLHLSVRSALEHGYSPHV